MDKHRPKPEAAQDRLSQRYPWPDSQPEGYLALSRWFLIDNQIGLSELLKPGDVVIELGSWLGESTRFMCDSVFPNGHVYAVDHWQGSLEHQDPKFKGLLDNLYDLFLYNSWNYRCMITPVREDTVTGLRAIAEFGDRDVTLIYMDASHQYEDVLRDLTLADQLFPKAHLTGDDWYWPDVRRAVTHFARSVSE